jgi:broad specificity phosphatase PhoE
MLVLVRHGRTAWNRERRLVGRHDVPLDDVGRDQALLAAGCLGAIAELRSSPLVRATQTAALLAPDREIVLDEAFLELDYGRDEGTLVADIDPERRRKVREDPTTRWPGGESLDDVQRRVDAACEALFAREGAGARREDGDVVVVSHVGPIKAAVAWALGTGAELALRTRLDNGSITRIGYGPIGPVLHAFNVVPGELR